MNNAMNTGVHISFLISIFVFFLTFIYVLIFGCAGSSLLLGLFSSCREWGLLSSCCVQASHCSGLSCCGAQALERAGSVVVASGL